MEILICFFIMMAINFSLKVIPVVSMSQKTMPIFFERFLKNAPIPIITALLCSEFIQISVRHEINFDLHKSLAAAPAMLVGLISKNIFLTVLTGIGALALIRLSM